MMDCIGDVEVQGNGESHRLHKGVGLVQQLDMGLEQLLAVALAAEYYHCIFFIEHAGELRIIILVEENK